MLESDYSGSDMTATSSPILTFHCELIRSLSQHVT